MVSQKKTGLNKNERYYYLITLQFLGFRFSGWQKQTNSKTLQEMFDKTITFILDHKNFKTLGAGRTDAMVSSNSFPCELFVYEKLDPIKLLEDLKFNLPADIDVIDVVEVDKDFQIITGSKLKEYYYFFSVGEKKYPFAAPFMANINEKLDIELMKKGAKLFLGKHNFKSYCYRPKSGGEFNREILSSEIVDNTIYTANFFPKVSYVYKVSGKGFMRHQIRLMIGTLFKLGAGEISLDDIQSSLLDPSEERLGFIAPSSGLMLNKTLFDSY